MPRVAPAQVRDTAPRAPRSRRTEQAQPARPKLSIASYVTASIAVVVGAQIDRADEARAHIFPAQFQPGLGDAIAELRIEHSKARSAERVGKLVVRAARGGIRRVIGTYAQAQSRNGGRREIQ